MMIKRTGWKNLNWIKDRRRRAEKGNAIGEIKVQISRLGTSGGIHDHRRY
jgi:hypothetical protein